MSLFAILFAAPAFAEAPAHTVTYRQVQMELAGRHMKSVALVIKGKVDRKADLAGHAAALGALATSFPDLFPAGTGPDAVPKTEALPSIWEKPSAFQEAAVAFQRAAKAFEEAVASGDDATIRAAFGKVGKSCGGCHDHFKKDDEH